MIEGFDRHYRLFRETSAAAKERFEVAAWPEAQQAVRERIRYYDERVEECVARLREELDAGSLGDAIWRKRSCSTSACSSTTSGPSSPRRSSTPSSRAYSSGRTSTTTSPSCARRSRPSTSSPTRPSTGATTPTSAASGRRCARVRRFRLEPPVREPRTRCRLPAERLARALRRRAAGARGRPPDQVIGTAFYATRPRT